MKLVVTVLTTAVALALAAWMLEGLSIGGGSTGGRVVTLLVVAAILGVVNTFVRPIVAILSLPLYILTLGLFFLIVNALMLLLTGWIAEQIDVPFRVDGFWTAVVGGLVISIASALIGLLLPKGRD